MNSNEKEVVIENTETRKVITLKASCIPVAMYIDPDSVGFFFWEDGRKYEGRIPGDGDPRWGAIA